MDHSLRYRRFRALLREIREEAGLHQSILAEKLGKTQKTVSKIELGERGIDFLETADFCAACNVSVNRFWDRFERSVSSVLEGKRVKRSGSHKGDSDGPQPKRDHNGRA